ncbi:hypothetical protein PUR49_00970 [Streptomyces sp. BE147]|uniref:hypothetical protein n=1 Tax=Streptomyces sp. BE147 TaxID=3002524 RepID=UPI002E79C5B0|nr:hypothetical protein [Streptomyces sp. BE147]MEE1735128.1 hypothetical protein [Streptomyces sp. BE147]
MRLSPLARAAVLSAAVLVLSAPASAYAATGVFWAQPIGDFTGGPAVENPTAGRCYDVAPGQISVAHNDTDAVAHTFPLAGCRGTATDIPAGGVEPGIHGSVRFDS